jgi:pre-mRNA-processing factor SLU7
LERPRSTRTSAWKSGVELAADDVVLDMTKHGKLSYAAKRDNWQGYDPNEYLDVIDRHERLENERMKEKQPQQFNDNVLAGESTNSDSDSDGEDDHDDVGKREFVSRDEDVRDFQGKFVPQGGVGGAGMRVTVRNLRIREDTPKYLRNLSLDSAFYDPKSRSMRANPYPNANPEDVPFAGDNFLRYSGDALKLSQNQVLCWEMQARGENVDVISNPSQAEYLQKLHVDKKETHKSARKDELLKRYGADSVSQQMDPRLLLGQSERYVEYDTQGKKLQESRASTSVTKYCEDEYPLNHTSIWGSFYDRETAAWGYSCCRSTLKNSYCVGLISRSEDSVGKKRPITSV